MFCSFMNMMNCEQQSAGAGLDHDFMFFNSKSFCDLLAEDDGCEKAKDTDLGETQVSSAKGGSSAKFRSMMPSSIPIPKSPGLFTVPPGLSPTALLDSPVLLPSSSQGMLSPTTGSFPLLPFSFENTTNDGFKNFDMGGSPGFAFKSFGGPGFGFDFQSFGNSASYGYETHQNFKGFQNATPMISTEHVFTEQHVSVPSQGGVSEAGPAPEDSFDDPQTAQSSDSNVNSDHVAAAPFGTLENPTDDGYNWRKYGQKHVKGSVCPRSYYKCTHPGCQTKKKVERSPDGQVTEIVYKGMHNHPKPQPTRRMGATANHLATEDGETVEGPLASAKVEDPSNLQGQNSTGTPDHSTISAEDDDDDRTSNYNRDDADGEEPDSKRMKTEPNALDIIGATRTIREPRVVVQTTSDIDILDDGYRWRKYGQKVVKGNPNPRSYYKCTNPGCQVRKHVERAAHDAKAVITTYEGKHNHDVPAPRSSSHSIVGIGNSSSLPVVPNNATPQTSAAVNLATSDIQGTIVHFDNKHDFGNGYKNNMGMPLDYGVFSLQNKHGEVHQPTEMPSSHAMQMKHGSGLNSSSMQSYFGQQNDTANGLIRPKEELTDNFQFKS
eukprot:TRINITY_DN6114_c0_g1_i1.p1 TRINITY_DN6114_c0_g1~~TRINITY_DN6114_c0_g1_i1.p1  ORF type:complete len:606 (+),score=135.01 TRINITY_DN6114_c0_g1_i1:223-2040(+)